MTFANLIVSFSAQRITRLEIQRSFRGLYIPEAVAGNIAGEAQQGPEASDDKLADDQPEEERQGGDIGAQASVAQQQALEKPAQEEAEPEKVHRIVACNGIAQRVQRQARIPQ